MIEQVSSIMDTLAAAVILAAGKGVRMVSERAKVLHPLCGEPMLGHVLRAVAECGPERTLVVVGHQAEEVKAAFADEKVEFVLQEEQRGTGHALMQTEKYLGGCGGEILVVPGDTPLLKAQTLLTLLKTHRETGATVSLLTARLPDAAGYGRVIRERDGSVARIVEDRDATVEEAAVNEINVGAYCFAASFPFEALLKVRDDNAQGELYLTDVVEVAVGNREKVAALEADADEVMGVNSRVELARAEKIMRSEINRCWMLRGVTMVNPAATYVDSGAKIGVDSVMHPGCHILGESVIGERCTVMPGAIVIDSRIGREARLGPYCILERISVPDGGEVAPFEIKRGTDRP